MMTAEELAKRGQARDAAEALFHALAPGVDCRGLYYFEVLAAAAKLALAEGQRSIDEDGPKPLSQKEGVHLCSKCRKPFKYLLHANGSVQARTHCTCGAAMLPPGIKPA